MENQLKSAYSPYLLQHANNPVNWQLYTNENLEQSKNKEQLLIISIGYAACHWCHVMEKECFEDEEVAAVMNASFTSYKIDREELPAVDAYYMQALQIMTKQGGWPLNIVALPNGLPVWGATYVPKEQWIEVLQQLARLFENDKEKMLEYAQQLSNGITFANNTLALYPKKDETIDIKPLIEKWKKSFDQDFGGYQRSPKFTMPTNLNFLLQYGTYKKDSELLSYVDNTLTKMAWGGLFDVVEGGFSRYSVDHKWHIPHFEKMLYDNAQLLTVYTQNYLQTNNELHKEVVAKTLEFINSNWKDHSGGYYAAYDADSKNASGNLIEGAYYSWKKEELLQVIPKNDWNLFADLFSVNEDGYWEEEQTYVFIQYKPLETIATKHAIPIEYLKEKKKNWESILYNERLKRTKPLLDDKIIISWNAQLLSGFINASKIIDNELLEKNILSLAAFLMNNAYTTKLGRAFKNGSIYIDGTLEDYAFTIKAFIDLFNKTQNIEYIEFARLLTFEVIDNLFKEEQGFFQSQDNEEIGTVFEIEDNVIPSANAIMSRNLYYIGIIYSNNHFVNTAKQMTARVTTNIDFASAYSDWLLNKFIFEHNFEYVVLKNLETDVLKTINKYSNDKLILWKELNLPILMNYKNQKMNYQVCNENSCRLSSNDFNELLQK